MLRLVLALAAAVALAGCGGQSDEEAVRQTVVDYLNAFTDEDAERLCELMTPASRDEIGGPECAANFEAQFERTESSGDRFTTDGMRFATVEVRGERATLDAGEDNPVELEKIDGEWRVDGG